MSIYLTCRYQLGPEAGRQDFIGPFRSVESAEKHRSEWGPLATDIVDLASLPADMVGVQTPEEHASWQRQRWAAL